MDGTSRTEKCCICGREKNKIHHLISIRDKDGVEKNYCSRCFIIDKFDIGALLNEIKTEGLELSNQNEIIELYKKERQYQKIAHGEYKNLEGLNFGSFILFIDNYIERVKEKYVKKWTRIEEFPNWLEDSYEAKSQGTAPVEAYQEMIKIFALAGSALETYCKVNVDFWREEGVKEKWVNHVEKLADTGERSNE